MNKKTEKLPLMEPLGTDAEMLDKILKETFEYFLKEVNPENGLIADKTKPGSPASIAASGLGLSTYVVAAQLGIISRSDAINKTLMILRFFHASQQGPEADATGYHGFYYHFLDMKTGKRSGNCELSTIDTGLFIIGALTAATYFNRGHQDENEIRLLAEYLYKKVDWVWSLNGTNTICHGWKPESGFLKNYWNSGYSEAHLLYILALGSPTFPINKKGYDEWVASFKLKKYFKFKYIYAAPLFIHQLSQTWLNLKGIKDDYNRKSGIDYFESSKRATQAQQYYAIKNPKGFKEYGKNCWGFTASDGPGPTSKKIDGKIIEFYGYKARGIPKGPDDGTVSPWAVGTSLPFAPDIVLPTLRYAIEHLNLKDENSYGFAASFNPTFLKKTKNKDGWISPWKFALNQGPLILMIENYRSGFIWKLMQQCPYVIKGLRCAGFKGGWLDN